MKANASYVVRRSCHSESENTVMLAKKDRAWDWAKEQEARKARRKKEAELADLHSTMALSAKISVATGLSYGQQVLLAQRQKKDLRAFLEGLK